MGQLGAAQPSEVENMGESIGESKMSGEKKAYIT